MNACIAPIPWGGAPAAIQSRALGFVLAAAGGAVLGSALCTFETPQPVPCPYVPGFAALWNSPTPPAPPVLFNDYLEVPFCPVADGRTFTTFDATSTEEDEFFLIHRPVFASAAAPFAVLFNPDGSTTIIPLSAWPQGEMLFLNWTNFQFRIRLGADPSTPYQTITLSPGDPGILAAGLTIGGENYFGYAADYWSGSAWVQFTTDSVATVNLTDRGFFPFIGPAEGGGAFSPHQIYFRPA